MVGLIEAVAIFHGQGSNPAHSRPVLTVVSSGLDCSITSARCLSINHLYHFSPPTAEIDFDDQLTLNICYLAGNFMSVEPEVVPAEAPVPIVSAFQTVLLPVVNRIQPRLLPW